MWTRVDQMDQVSDVMMIEPKKQLFVRGPDAVRRACRIGLAPDWAGEIQRVWDRGDNTLELARVVCDARWHLRRGEWSKLWRSATMPFSKRKAEILVAIHRGVAWVGDNAQISARLPRAWNTLYYLGRLERTLLERLVQEGAIHPRLKLSEAKKLVEQNRSGRGTAKAKRHPVLRRLQKLADFVDSTLDGWSPQQLVLAGEQHQAILGKISSRQQSLRVPETSPSQSDVEALSLAPWQIQFPALGAKAAFTERTPAQQPV